MVVVSAVSPSRVGCWLPLSLPLPLLSPLPPVVAEVAVTASVVFPMLKFVIVVFANAAPVMLAKFAPVFNVVISV